MTATATVPGCPVDESFDPLSPEFLADPCAALARRPGQGSPVFFAPDLIPAAVEESLRYDPSVAVWRRVTTRPVTLAGVDLPDFTFHPNISFRGPPVLRVRTGR